MSLSIAIPEYLEASLGHHRHFMHKHDHHEITYCIDGEGFQYTEFGKTYMKEGDLFLFPAGQKHVATRLDPDGVCILRVHNLETDLFSKVNKGDEEITEILDNLSSLANEGKNKIEVSTTGNKLIKKLFHQIHKEAVGRKLYYKGALKGLSQSLLVTIMREGKFSDKIKQKLPRTGTKDKIQNICRIIESNYMYSFTVEQMAEQAQMSRSHFHLLFNKIIGMTFLQYLNKKRVHVAIRLLRTTELSTGEIAEAVGFSSTSNFYRTFRLETGKSPKMFRISSCEHALFTPHVGVKTIIEECD